MATDCYDGTLSGGMQRHGSVQRLPIPNRVKSKANPTVLSSIISSLETDTLTPLPDTDLYADSHSHSHSRAYSSDRSVASSASIYRAEPSPGFGVEYGVGLALDDDEGLTNAALPPTVPTSRPPSGLSNYIATPAPRSPVFARSSSRSRLSIGRTSRRSSFSATSVTSSRNKLSSESWVRQSERQSEDIPDSARGRPQRKGGRLRRMSSQDMLRPPTFQSPAIHGLDSPTTSRAEEIIARTPSHMSSSKGRLFLADVAIDEDQTPSPGPYPSPPWSEQAERSVDRESNAASLENQSTAALTPPLLQMTPSPISDSIPTRTSSLRQSSSSPGGKKRKSKKAKRNSFAPSKSGASSLKPPKVIEDSTWDDLDEDDETVKRIRELREQRRSRLQESFFPPVSDAVEEASDEQVTPARELAAQSSDEAKRTSSIRPAANRSATEPTQPHSTLNGNIETQMPPQEPNGAQTGAKATNTVPDALRMAKHTLDAKRPLSAQQYRPTTARSEYSTIQPHSLDYSYAEAVDVLHGIAHTKHMAKDESDPKAAVEPSPLWLKGLDLPATPSQTTFITPKQKSTRFKKSPRNSKWTANHPDIPLDFNAKKNRRKSMNDAARHAQVLEESLESPRRDSIADAVVDYLRAPRLSRTIKSPNTGRTIAFSEVGDPEGAAVFICVGMGLTRYVTAFYDELATTLRLRLITVDRPGVGGSEAYPSSDKSGPLGWPEDILAICQELGIAKFSLLAHSAGAIYALATALILPHLIKGKVHLLAPWVPPSQLEAISHPAASAPPANPLPRSQRFLRVLPTPFLNIANASFMGATSTSLKPASKRKDNNGTPRRGAGAVRSPTSPTSPTSNDRPEYNQRRESMMLMDQYMPSTTPLETIPQLSRGLEEVKRDSLHLSATAVPTDPSFTFASTGLNAAEHAESQRQSEYTSRLTQSTWDLATRDSNPATDLVVCLERNRDVGFRYTDVSREVVITHGSEDKRVPIANVKWLAEQMNRRALGINLGANGRESRETWADPSTQGGCEVRVLQGEGHGLMASPIIMSDVLTEIAGYWIGPDKGRL
jgi:pimeloyl-ACP methyl ester carboxylesterase